MSQEPSYNKNERTNMPPRGNRPNGEEPGQPRKTWDTKVLAGELCAVLNKWLSRLKNTTEEELFREFNQHLYRRDQPTRFRRGNKVFEATVKKVLPSGELEVEHSFTESIRHGETEWLLI